MSLPDRLVIIFARTLSRIIQVLGLGAGETWPGELALMLRPGIADAFSKCFRKGIILVAGTNGKTTTTLMIKQIFEHIGGVVVHNATGANLLNGVVSSCIRRTDWLGRMGADIGLFEVDENSLPVVLSHMTPDRVVLLNLFRDQLDRYGEVDVIVEKWQRAFSTLPPSTGYIINGDDPGTAWIGSAVKGKVVYFGIDEKALFIPKHEHAMDSAFCPKCGGRLSYDGVYYSHIGVWKCPSCKRSRPALHVRSWQGALPGLYNRYNTLAAAALAASFGISPKTIKSALASFKPAFGRQEEIVKDGRFVKLYLSKNPAGFNASLRTVIGQGARHFLFMLNDRIPDGRDVSWIWDVDIETLPESAVCFVSGDRAYDMALRLKYAGITMHGEHEFGNAAGAIEAAVTAVPEGETLYVLPTYSAMLEARLALTGRKIL